MDLNLVVVGGRLASSPEVCVGPEGSITLECLVTVRTQRNGRRVDVLRVLAHDAEPSLVDTLDAPGIEVAVVGSLQRRLTGESPSARARMVVVADAIRVMSRSDAPAPVN